MSTVTTPLLDRTSLLVATGLVVGVVVSDQVFYRFLVVPRLGEWQSVPLHQWLIVSLPAVLAGLIGGAYLPRGQRLVAAPLGAIGTLGYLTLAAVLQSPGHGKSLALEAPGQFWGSGLFVISMLFIVLLFLGRIVRLLRESVDGA